MFRQERSGALSRIVAADEFSSQDSAIVCVTLDAEVGRLRLHRVDFMKIDIEGGESNALSGARFLLSGSNPPIVLFEWIPAFRARCNESAFVTLRTIVGSNWRLFRVGWGQPVMEIGYREPDVPANIIGFPPSRRTALNQFLKQADISGA